AQARLFAPDQARQTNRRGPARVPCRSVRGSPPVSSELIRSLPGLLLPAPPRVLAVVRLGELTRGRLLPPDLIPGPLRMQPEVLVSLVEVPIDGLPGFVHRLVIAVVEDRLCHAAEDRLDNIQELGTGGERDQLHPRHPSPVPIVSAVHLFNPCMKGVAVMP